MKNIYKIQKAIRFATQVHEIDEKQKRKGKDIPYITHPLNVGLLLAHIGAESDVVCAGILHDTIEDSIEEKKVTVEMLEAEFGKRTAELVLHVTEQDKSLSWEERKKQAKEHIEAFDHDTLLVKSADILSNGLELVADYEKDGEVIFERFNASKVQMLQNQLEVIALTVKAFPESPFAQELKSLAYKLQSMGVTEFMPMSPARCIKYSEYDESEVFTCPICGWQGTAEGNIEPHEGLFDVSCPICDKMLLVVSYQ